MFVNLPVVIPFNDYKDFFDFIVTIQNIVPGVKGEYITSNTKFKSDLGLFAIDSEYFSRECVTNLVNSSGYSSDNYNIIPDNISCVSEPEHCE